MALYGAPVWADRLTLRNIMILRRPLRAMSIRAIRGYRTISFEAASLLAGLPPWDMEAKVLASLHQWREAGLEQGMRPAPQEVKAERVRLHQILEAEWGQRLEQPSFGAATIEAIRPVMAEWLRRQHGTLTFRLTQVLSGHGCFGKYLCRIRKEPTAECHHCGCEEDSANHTLAVCPAWELPRRELVAAVGNDLSHASVVVAMLESEERWDSIASFCEQIMSTKEEAERERERNTPSRALRHQSRRRRDDLRPP